MFLISIHLVYSAVEFKPLLDRSILKDNYFFLYLILIGISIILLLLGNKYEDIPFKFFSGLLFIIFSSSFYINGYLFFNNPLILIGIPLISLGLGFYIMIELLSKNIERGRFKL